MTTCDICNKNFNIQGNKITVKVDASQLDGDMMKKEYEEERVYCLVCYDSEVPNLPSPRS